MFVEGSIGVFSVSIYVSTASIDVSRVSIYVSEVLIGGLRDAP